MGNKPAVVYSNVWEDPELNRQALQVKPGQSVLSITSGGCNSLCLLLEDPSRVVSIDLNPAQLAMLELKRAAIIELDYEDFLEVLGVPFYGKPPRLSGPQRLELYRRIRGHLSSSAAEFWEENPHLIEKGAFWCGKVEAFFDLYRKILSWFYDFSDMEALFRCPDLAAQQAKYRGMKRRRWRFLNSILLNKFVLSLVKGAHSFAMVEDPDLAGNLSRKIDKGMTDFYNPDNYFMALMLLGGHWSRQAMSPYLLESNWAKMKANIGRLEIYQGTCGDVLKKYGPASFDAMQMSNIFEWMEHDFFNGVIRELLELGRPGARLCWRYTLARPRQLDAANSERLVPETELARCLFNIDRSFIYESFHVYRLKA